MRVCVCEEWVTRGSCRPSSSTGARQPRGRKAASVVGTGEEKRLLLLLVRAGNNNKKGNRRLAKHAPPLRL
jgi:hypothetical protein